MWQELREQAGNISRTSNSKMSLGFAGDTGMQLEAVEEPLERSHGV